jgi:RNA polymerase sigma-70 factor (ECF subfamily)
MSGHPLDLLLEQLARGDAGAAEHVFREYEPYLRMIVRRYLPTGLRPKFDSVDVVQSVWVHVWRGLRQAAWQFSDREHLKALLVTVTRRRLVSRYRHFRSSAEHEVASSADLDRFPSADLPRPEDQARANELWERMLALSSTAHHEMLRLRRQGCTMEEIARKTGMHEGSVRRIFRRLARQLALSEQPLQDTCESAH